MFVLFAAASNSGKVMSSIVGYLAVFCDDGCAFNCPAAMPTVTQEIQSKAGAATTTLIRARFIIEIPS
jgi:hypothetical protein